MTWHIGHDWARPKAVEFENEPASEYEAQAKEFLERTNSTMKLIWEDDVQGFPFDKHDKLMHRKYYVSLSRDGGREPDAYGGELTFDFYGSYADFKAGDHPTEYDILACLYPYDIGTIDNFFYEFGYIVNDWSDVRRIEAAYEEMNRQYNELKKMYSPEELEQLGEIL